ncbi:MAG: DUF1145 domain-containing protein [Bermanella sp.]
MQNFFKINKYAILGFWVVFIVNFFMPVGGDVASVWIMRLGFATLVVHALELAFVYKSLQRAERATAMDVVWVMLAGLFHWQPLLSK